MTEVSSPEIDCLCLHYSIEETHNCPACLKRTSDLYWTAFARNNDLAEIKNILLFDKRELSEDNRRSIVILLDELETKRQLIEDIKRRLKSIP